MAGRLGHGTGVISAPSERDCAGGLIVRRAGAQILHDPVETPEICSDFFESAWWQQNNAVVGRASGRGTVFFVRATRGEWALRRYLRGGWMRRVSRDRYVWSGLENTRPWREWRLLAALRAKKLPVPRPIGARVKRAGCTYTGELITERIEPGVSLKNLLRERALPAGEWTRIGAMLREFHGHGVRHDDINVSNIIRGEDGQFYLIDFDKARIVPAGRWAAHNLARLHRSLEKQRRRFPVFHCESSDWSALIEGYGRLPVETPGLGAKLRSATSSVLGLGLLGWIMETFAA